ncbi:MAG: hypothetical protein H6741_23250 [Alphaproteobacteria bacterium]|nr:hypothetical protein [Alphaproteobacteria bacterium]
MSDIRVRDARRDYFIQAGFGEGGNYEDTWAWFVAGPLRVPIYNTAGRIYAVRYHDLHHLITGYRTDWRGEFEIAAWEIGAGCGDASFAWMINLSGLGAGLLTLPRRTAAAFYRGRRSRSLYGREIESLLDMPLAALQAEVGTDQAAVAPTLRDRLALLGWFLVSIPVWLPQLALLLSPILLPLLLLGALLR